LKDTSVNPERANHWPGMDAGMALQFAIGHRWPGTTQAECWTSTPQEKYANNS
jgi:hypothetical protein